jgi:hypothetical protein
VARKPNYDFERRRREQERRKKKEAKREERQRRKEEGGDGDPDLASAEELAALGLPMPVVDRLPDELIADEDDEGGDGADGTR